MNQDYTFLKRLALPVAFVVAITITQAPRYISDAAGNPAPPHITGMISMCGISRFAWTVNNALARSAQPPSTAWQCLKQNGFTTILRQNLEGSDATEQSQVQAQGMVYINSYRIAVSTAYSPAMFQAMINDIVARLKQGERILVHDEGGRGRMGFWEASFLMWDGWASKAAIDRQIVFDWNITCSEVGNGQMQGVNEIAVALGQPIYYPAVDNFGNHWNNCPRPAYMNGWNYATIAWPACGGRQWSNSGIISCGPVASATATATGLPANTATRTPTPTFTGTATRTPTSTSSVPALVTPTRTNTPLPTSTLNAGLIFMDGFESGNFSNWTSTVRGSQSGSVNEIISGAAYSGSFGAHFSNGVGGTVSSGSYAYKDFSAPASRIVSVQTRIKINSIAGAGSLRLLQVRDIPSGQSMLRVRYLNGSYQLYMVRRNGTVVTSNFVTNLVPGTWQVLELMYDWSGTQPVGKVWVNASLQATLIDSATGTNFAATRATIEVYEDVITASGDAYFDEVKVANGFIGTGATPSATPTLSNTTTPTNTLTPTKTPTPSNTPTNPSPKTATPTGTQTVAPTLTRTPVELPSVTPTPTKTPAVGAAILFSEGS